MTNPICTMQDNRDNMKFDDTDMITRELYNIACNPMIPREYRTEILKDYQTERKAKAVLPGWGGSSVKDYIDDLVWDKGCSIERDGFHYHLRSKNGADFYLGKEKNFVVEYAILSCKYRDQDAINNQYDGQYW